jgi:putative transposase
LRKDYPVNLLCRVLKVSTSGYYEYLKRPKHQVTNEDRQCLKLIKKAYFLHEGTYGAKRISGYLKTKGIILNHKKVARIMSESDLKSVIRIPKTTKDSKGQAAGYVYENHLKRDFDASHPNQKWVTDMTEIQVEKEKFYVSAIVDLFNREVIAFETSSSPNKELIEATLIAAQKKRKLKSLAGILIHSDQGSVYRSYHYHKLSQNLKFIPSMSRKANCWDNAVIESFFSQFKTEYPCFYPNIKIHSFQQDLNDFIRYYNENRIQYKLGLISPKSYITNYQKTL